MGLLGDLEEGKDWWGKASFSGRCLIAVITFLSISSITSISDKVFQWKGFISTGLDFYREFITGPLVDLLTYIGLNLRQDYIDIYVLIVFMFNSMYRRQVFDKPILFKVTAFLLCMLITAVILVFINYFTHGTSEDNRIALLIMIGFLTLSHPFGKKFSKGELIAYYAPIFLSILCILVLAAINHGLERTV